MSDITERKKPLYIPYAGPTLLETPLLNKSSAFSHAERKEFNLTGLLPPRYETIQEQVSRAYQQYRSFETPLNKHIYLRAIQDNNETMFFRLVKEHIEEMMPIIYTPTVGDACEQFSDIYRSARGLFISYEDQDQIDDILRNATKRNVKVIVITDGERILGLGDQGIGGMGIPIGKLSLYTVCGGISPAYTLPIMIDVGTNNEKLLKDPMYMGARHPRITGEQYDLFVDKVMQGIKNRWPGALVQFEDFAQQNAMPLLKRYQDDFCCFNDDIQGTAAVTTGTLLAACKTKNESITEQKIVFVGSGSAGCGIAEQIIAHMCQAGLTREQAKQQIFMVDRFGLLTDKTPNLRDFQSALAQPDSVLENWSYSGEYPALLDVIHCAKPTVLIGVSGQAGLFTEQIIRTLHQYCPQPIVFPLSNPSRQIEALPADVLTWTNYQAIVATGSPFEPILHDGKTYPIAQCNNSYIFPGIGLGVLAARSSRVTEEMMIAASETLAKLSPKANNQAANLLPALQDIEALSREIAFAVGKVAQAQGHALEIDDTLLKQRIQAMFWQPDYREYRRVSL